MTVTVWLVTMWQCDCVTVWQCGYVTMWLCYNVAVLQCGYVTMNGEGLKFMNGKGTDYKQIILIITAVITGGLGDIFVKSGNFVSVFHLYKGVRNANQ